MSFHSCSLLRYPAIRHEVTYRCGQLKVLLVASRIAVAHFRSEKIQDQVSQKFAPHKDYFSALRITEAVETTDADMINRIWYEIAYRWDICHVTRGNHIEHH